MVEDSVLKNVRTLVHLGTDDTSFDDELLLYINAVFSTLNQMGVGPEIPPLVVDDSYSWTTYLEGRKDLEEVRTYLGLRVRLMFDPPATSFGIEALKGVLSEYEWRLNVASEGMKNWENLKRSP